MEQPFSSGVTELTANICFLKFLFFSLDGDTEVLLQIKGNRLISVKSGQLID